MLSKHFVKAGIAALVLTGTFIFCWEWYWRSKGFNITYNDDKMLWAQKRKEVYRPINQATVFIGSSRIKFDLDIPTWEKSTGEHAVQLALVGTSPRLLLQDLANDENFRGKLVVDVTEVLFFSQNPAFHKSAKEAIAFYKKQTPSEKLSSKVGLALESQFVFLEERRFSLNTLLADLEIPNRAGVFSMPPFPKGFEWTRLNRQTYMSDGFLADTLLLNRQTNIWKTLIMGDPAPPVSGTALQNIFKEVSTAVEKIKSRGGKVIFVRTPSSGPMAEGEQKVYPRSAYWDSLLAYSHVKGIHYADHTQTASLICPEWSHLAPKDAVWYTRQLLEQLQQEGWFGSNTAKL
jgi:hypothetical protein